MGKSKTMKEVTVNAVVQNLDIVTDFVNEQLEMLDCPVKKQMQIDVVLDEIFGNICHYAYTQSEGEVTVRMEEKENGAAVELTFIDSGVRYNPLEKEDPDTTLSIEEKPIGGLGIFIVKKTMDELSYRYEKGQNILTVKKYL